MIGTDNVIRFLGVLNTILLVSFSSEVWCLFLERWFLTSWETHVDQSRKIKFLRSCLRKFVTWSFESRGLGLKLGAWGGVRMFGS